MMATGSGAVRGCGKGRQMHARCDLTEGSITWNVLRTTAFVLASMVVQSVYYLVDLHFVGRLGRDAVAAVSVCANLTLVVMAGSQMLGVGTAALISNAVGRGDRRAACLVFNQAQALSFLVGAVFFVVMIPLRRAYASALAADAASVELAVAYLTWFVPAMAVLVGMGTVAAALRGSGRFKPPMVVHVGTVLLNVALAPVLTLGWGSGHAFGVVGAAWATLISIATGVLALRIYVIRSVGYLEYSVRDWVPRLGLWWKLVKVGLPAGAQFILMSIYQVVVYALCRPFGVAAQAGFGIGQRIVQTGFLPVLALSAALTPVAGQNFGAGRPDRVRESFRIGVVVASAMMLALSALVTLVPAPIIRFFQTDPDVLAVGSEYLRIISLNFVPSGLVFVSSSMFQAMGNTAPSLVGAAPRVLLLVVSVYLLSSVPGLQLRWIWYLSVASVVAQAGCNLAFVRREFRRRLSAVRGSSQEPRWTVAAGAE